MSSNVPAKFSSLRYDSEDKTLLVDFIVTRAELLRRANQGRVVLTLSTIVTKPSESQWRPEHDDDVQDAGNWEGLYYADVFRLNISSNPMIKITI